MLAHPKNFNFTALLKDRDAIHVLLLDLLDRDFFAGALMHAHLNEAKLSFAKNLLEVVKIEDV